VGAFSFSHSLEAAVEDGAVRDRASLQDWICTVVASGSGRIDADILRDAYRAAIGRRLRGPGICQSARRRISNDCRDGRRNHGPGSSVSRYLPGRVA